MFVYTIGLNSVSNINDIEKTKYNNFKCKINNCCVVKHEKIPVQFRIEEVSYH